MEKKSNNKTIFWTSLISIILTLTAVVYFTNYMRNFDEGEFEYFLKSLGIICFLFFIPATIIYSIIFGKIELQPGENYYFFFFILATFIWVLLMEGFDLIDFFEDRKIGMIVLGIISLIITKMTTNSVFKSINQEENKEENEEENRGFF